jgi:CO dehydrogenase maturation factor
MTQFDATTVRSLLGAAIEDEADLALVDIEAGLEHLSRSGGTLALHGGPPS